jgi:hypothetical protein
MSKLDYIKTHSPTAIHDHMVARPYLGAIRHGMIGCSYRIGDDAALYQRDLIREEEDILGRSGNILCERSIPVVTKHLHPLADILVPGAAGRAATTGEDRRQQYAVAHFDVLCAVPHLRHYARRLMPKNQGRAFRGRNAVIDIVEIGVA